MATRLGKYKATKRDSALSLVDGGTVQGSLKVNTNAEFKKVTATSGILNQNLSVDATTSTIDLTSTASDFRLVLTGTAAGQIKLPQATAANAGMVIEVLFAADCANNDNCKIGVAQGESTIIKGVIAVQSTTADQVMTVPIHATVNDTQNIVFHDRAQDHSGGKEGTIARFYYAEADLIWADVRGVTDGNNPALSTTAGSATGWS